MARTLAEGRKPGSGRPPGILKQFTPERAEQVTIKGASKPLELPNLSGMKKYSDERGGLFTQKLDEIDNPAGDTTFTFGANKHLHWVWTGDAIGDDGQFEIEGKGGWRGDLVHIHQHTGNVTVASDLVHLEAEDAQVTNLRIHNTQATNVMEIGAAGSSVLSITNLGVITWPSGGSAATNTHIAGDGSDHADVATNTTHSGDSTQAHSDYLKNDAADVGVGLTLTGDNSSADTAYVPMVLYNTDDTPPAANTVPIGTIYIQYTA